MRKTALLVTAALLGQISSQAWAFDACYQVSAYPHERYRLNVVPQGVLTTPAEEEAFGHLPQAVGAVQGKHVGTCGAGTVRPVHGTYLTTRPAGAAFEGWLGLVSMNSTGAGGNLPPATLPLVCRDVEITCKTGDVDGFPPPLFHCFGENKFGIQLQFDLTLVDVATDPNCSLFQDGPPDAAAEANGPATGRN
jgi:hypothetical protein